MATAATQVGHRAPGNLNLFKNSRAMKADLFFCLAALSLVALLSAQPRETVSSKASPLRYAFDIGEGDSIRIDSHCHFGMTTPPKLDQPSPR